jgi:hypothetical protein
MTLSEIVAQLDTEIHRLQEARALLSDLPAAPTVGAAARPGPKGSKLPPSAGLSEPPAKRRALSHEARLRMSLAQSRRWAKSKRAAKKAAVEATAAASRLAEEKAAKKVAKKAAGTAVVKKVVKVKIPAKKSAVPQKVAPAKKATPRKKAVAKPVPAALPPATPSPQVPSAEN